MTKNTEALAAAMDLLERQLPDLDAAAMPTKCETYVQCGRYARELHTAIGVVLTALRTPPSPVTPITEEALREALRQIEKYCEFFCEEDFDTTVDQLRAALASLSPVTTDGGEGDHG